MRPRDFLGILTFMNSRQFLLFGGALLILLGLLGVFGIIGFSSADPGVFGRWWYFTKIEGWVHAGIGLLLVISSVIPRAHWRYIAIFFGVLSVLSGIYSLLGPVPEGEQVFSMDLQNPGDTIFHLLVGSSGFIASKHKAQTEA